MKVITSHERADMDAMAAIYAASLLYPDYQAVLPQKLNRNLRDLLALYRDELPFVERRDLPRRSISRVILVDTQAIPQLRGTDANATTPARNTPARGRPCRLRPRARHGGRVPTTTVASCSSEIRTVAARPASVRIAIAVPTWDSPISISSRPPGASHRRASAASRR